MERTYQLSSKIESRLRTLPPEIYRRYSEAQDVVVFGSFASGLERVDSDLDIFCVGANKTHFKSKAIEVMILPDWELYSELWLGSELANHIATYGVALGDAPLWFRAASLSSEAAEKKTRRVRGYLRSLEKHWNVLGPLMRQRYELTVRREVQRLGMLIHNRAIPPTKTLDAAFNHAQGMDKALLNRFTTIEQDIFSKLFPGLFS